MAVIYDLFIYKCQGAQNVLLGRQELRCQYGDEDKSDVCTMFRTNKMLMMRMKIHVYVVQASPETTTANI